MIDDIVSSVGGVSGGMYSLIDKWEMWWRGRDPSFHHFTENSCVGSPVRRELYRMNMAKKICEDWASLLINDRCSIHVADENGEDFVGKILRGGDFLCLSNRLTEKAFALGTAAVILRLHGFVSDGEKLRASDGSFITFEAVDAGHIIPISVEGGRITEAAFVSECVRRGVRCCYVETHRKEDGKYVIRNEFYPAADGEEASLVAENADASCEIRTGSPYPFFAILSPNIQNNYCDDCGMGVSVFADAIDCLKGVDLAFNNFCRDIKLGGKKVFVSSSLVKRDDFGNIITPDDVAQQLFVTVGDGDFDEHPMITEHNPELRTDEDAQAVRWQLSYLAFRCGLGSHHYTFDVDGRAKLTATQYMGERQDMRQNLVKHQHAARAYITAVVRALLWCAAEYYGIDADVGAEVSVMFDDSYFGDSDTRRESDLREVEAGVMSAEEYRAKWSGGIINE